jgi:hypothetical protein
MFPHNFFVKEIEFWSGYNWGTIKLESAHARTVLLEHAKYHPFKPFTDGKLLILYYFEHAEKNKRLVKNYRHLFVYQYFNR